jgi:hypothetical protein
MHQITYITKYMLTYLREPEAASIETLSDPNE